MLEGIVLPSFLKGVAGITVAVLELSLVDIEVTVSTLTMFDVREFYYFCFNGVPL